MLSQTLEFLFQSIFLLCLIQGRKFYFWKVEKLEASLSWQFPNAYGGLHGGAIGAAAERVAIACARTVVGKEKDIFLGELSISYLYAAPHNAATSFLLKGKRRGCDAELVVEGSVLRSGRNLTVVTVDFRLKGSGRLAFMTRSTFFNMPVSRM